MISYSPLWETLKKKEITQYKLLQMGLDKHTLQNLRENKSITISPLETICAMLECTPNDIVCFSKQKPAD